MATPMCSQHEDQPAIIIVSFMSPEVAEPTTALCEECAPQMAASILQASFPDKNVLEWLFADDTAAEPPESAPKRKRAPKAAKSVAEFQGSDNGPLSPEESEPPTDTDQNESDQSADEHAAAVAE